MNIQWTLLQNSRELDTLDEMEEATVDVDRTIQKDDEDR